MARFPFSFRSKISGNPRLDLALATNFDKAASEEWVASYVASHGGGGSSVASGVSVTPTGSIAATDVQAALAELDAEKQPLLTTGSVTTTHILDGTIVDGDVSASANISLSKLATDPLARANHTGTQAQSTVTNLTTDLAGKQPLDSDLTTIAALDSGTSAGVLATEAAGWVKRTYAQVKTSLGLVKADVGLGNVDNTSDANKPVSTAQQTALDLKANLASPTLTGTPAAPTAADGTNTTQIATTAFVNAATGNASTVRPVCIVASTDATSIANATTTFITFNTELTDTDAMFSASSDKITLNTAGTYNVSSVVEFAANATGVRLCGLYHYNSAGTLRRKIGLDSDVASSAVNYIGNLSGIIAADAGDYVKLLVYQTSGGALSLSSTNITTYTAMLSVAWVGGTGSAWGNAGAKVTHDTTQNLTTGTLTVLALNTETFDIDGMHSNTTNNSRLTCVTPGTYYIRGAVEFAANATDSTLRQVLIRLNGATTISAQRGNSMTSDVEQSRLETSCIYQLNAGDYVELLARQDSGSTIAVNNNAYSPFLEAVRIGYQSNPQNIGVLGRMTKATQTFTTGTEAKFTGFTQTVENNAAVVDVDTANSRIYGMKTGNYTVNAGIGFPANATGSRYLVVKKNGSTVLFYETGAASPTAGVGTNMSGVQLIDLVAGDYIEMSGYQSSGGNLDASAWLSLQFNGPA